MIFRPNLLTNKMYLTYLVCSGDSDCSSGFFCGSSVPDQDKNLFDNPGALLAGEVVFLQRDSMGFDGMSVVSLPSNSQPSLMSDLTIFATICQSPNNDGYVVGKGINDRIRDFGLYLRSSRQTIWLAYGTDGNNPGFRSFIYFYNITLADGVCHSIGAVIDSTSNRAVLYIDGEAARVHAPLPSVPEFRPNVSSNHNTVAKCSSEMKGCEKRAMFHI